MGIFSLAGVVGWLATKGIGTITRRIEAWEERKARAQELENNIEVKRIEGKLERLRLVQALQDKDERENKRLRAWIRALIGGLPVGILIWKVLVYDMAAQQCGQIDTLACTPAPGIFVMVIVNAVVAWYFLFEGRD